MTTMDTASNFGGSPSPADSSSSAWQLSALLQPGLVRAGTKWLSLAPRLWVEWASRITRDALERALERPVSIESLSDADRMVQRELAARGLSAREAAFAVAISHPTLGDGWVVLDLTAARVIVDSLEADFASLRGAETLSDAEMGLLEYATLACIDHALRAVGSAGQAFAIKDFPDLAKLRDTLESDQRYRVTLRLRIAGRQGFVRVYLPAFPAEPPEALPIRTRSSEEGSGAVEIRLALPSMKLSRDELKSIRAGDVLMPGITDLASMNGCMLASTNGWTLANAAVARDSATSITIRSGPLTLGVREAGEGDRVIVTALFGRLECPLDELRHIKSGDSIELRKDTIAPVELYDGLDYIGRGELIKIDGEIGIRLTDCRRPQL